MCSLSLGNKSEGLFLVGARESERRVGGIAAPAAKAIYLDAKRGHGKRRGWPARSSGAKEHKPPSAPSNTRSVSERERSESERAEEMRVGENVLWCRCVPRRCAFSCNPLCQMKAAMLAICQRHAHNTRGSRDDKRVWSTGRIAAGK